MFFWALAKGKEKIKQFSSQTILIKHKLLYFARNITKLQKVVFRLKILYKFKIFGKNKEYFILIFILFKDVYFFLVLSLTDNFLE